MNERATRLFAESRAETTTAEKMRLARLGALAARDPRESTPRRRPEPAVEPCPLAIGDVVAVRPIYFAGRGRSAPGHYHPLLRANVSDDPYADMVGRVIAQKHGIARVVLVGREPEVSFGPLPGTQAAPWIDARRLRRLS